MIFLLFFFVLVASSLTSTTPRSALGGNRQNPPWLSPSNPFGGSSETKSIDSSAIGLTNRGGSSSSSTNEEPLAPDIPYGPPILSNLSKYGHSEFPSGMNYPLLPPETDQNPSVGLVVTTTVLPTSSSSSSAVLLSEVNPLIPPGSSSDSDGDGNLRVMNSDEDDETLSENDDRPWAGMGADKDVGGDVTESMDWSQFDREKSKADNGGGTENMWSDKVAGGDSTNGGQSSSPNSNNNNNHNNENALGPVRGVVTVSPTVFPTQRNHGGSDEIDMEKNHRYNSPHGRFLNKLLFIYTPYSLFSFVLLWDEISSSYFLSITISPSGHSFLCLLPH